MPTLASPNSWTLLAALVAAVILVRYLARTSHDYPMRGKLIGLAAIAIAVTATVLGVRLAPAARQLVARADGARRTFLASRPAEPLAAYLAIPPMVDGVRLAEAADPALRGNSPRTGWTAHTTAGAGVIRFYRDSTHRAGWALELSADSMLVLARPHVALGQRGVERMSIRLRAPAAVEYELTRSYGPRRLAPAPAAGRAAAPPVPAAPSEAELLSEAGLAP